MKTLGMILAVMTLSSSAQAMDQSDFERGYYEGQKSCQTGPDEAWLCQTPPELNERGYGADEKTGISRADAILKFPPYIIDAVQSTGHPFICSKI